MTTYHADELAKLRQRAKAVADAVKAERRGDEPIVRRTPHGEVRLDRIEHRVGSDGVDYVEVWAPDAPDPHFRIFNPPLLAEDPNGEIELELPGGRKQRYAEDPVGALAEVLARHGAVKKKGRRLR